MVYKDHKQFRLPGYDYSLSGFYFITICTHNRVDYFGEILLDNGGKPSMALSAIGKIACHELLNTPRIRPYVILDAWIIMPNHVHAIFVLQNQINDIGRNAPRRVPTESGIRPLGRNSLSSVVNHYKGAVKRECNKRDLDFFWQPRFNDRIIRNERELQNIRHYIRTNVINWQQDRNNRINRLP